MDFSHLDLCTLLSVQSDPSHNIYALALSKSRYESPTKEIIIRILALLQLQGNCWLEVLHRLSRNDYGLVFSCCLPDVNTYVVLIKELPLRGDEQQKRCLLERVRQVAEEWGGHSESILEIWMRTELYEMETLELLVAQNVRRKRGRNWRTEKDDFNGNSYQFNTQLCNIFRRCKDISLQKLVYRAFKRRYAEILDWLHQILRDSLCLLESDSLELLQSIMALASLSEMRGAFRQQKVVQWLKDTDISMTRDSLNYEYGLMNEEWGDDVPSQRARLLYVLCERVDGLLLEVLRQWIGGVCRCLKLLVLHKVLKERSDCAEWILGVLSTLPVGDEMEECRKMRLVSTFRRELKGSQLSACIRRCTQQIEHGEGLLYQESANILMEVAGSGSDCTMPSPASMLEGLSQLVKKLIHRYIAQLNMPNTLGDCASVGNILNDNSNTRLLAALEILHELLVHHERTTSSESVRLLPMLSQVIAVEIRTLWESGLKNSQLLTRLIDLFKLSVEGLDEDTYVEYEDYVHNVVGYLKQSSRIECEDVLLGVLAGVLKKTKQVSGQLCMILSQMDYCEQVFRALCNRQLVNDILFNWTDLVPQLATILLRQLEKRQSEIQMYEKEYRESVQAMLLFLMSYQEFFISEQGTTNTILFAVHQIPLQECRLQLMLTINHIKPVHHYEIYRRSSPITQKYTAKMVYVYYCDGLLQKYTPQRMEEFLCFHQTYGPSLNRQLGHTPLDHSEFGSIIIREYILNALKTLRLRKQIDSVDAASLIEEFRFTNTTVPMEE